MSGSMVQRITRLLTTAALAATLQAKAWSDTVRQYGNLDPRYLGKDAGLAGGMHGNRCNSSNQAVTLELGLKQVSWEPLSTQKTVQVGFFYSETAYALVRLVARCGFFGARLSLYLLHRDLR